MNKRFTSSEVGIFLAKEIMVEALEEEEVEGATEAGAEDTGREEDTEAGAE